MVQAQHTSASVLKAGQLSAVPVLPLLILLSFKPTGPNLRLLEH